MKRISNDLKLTAGGSAGYSGSDRLRYLFADRHLPGGWILDDGCGRGIHTVALAKSGRRVVAIDPDIRAVLRRRSVNATSRIDYLPKQSVVLPFRDKSFDGAVSLEVIEHTTDPARYMSELARVLRSGGTLVLSTPNKRVTEPYYIDGKSPINITHISELCPEELRRLLDPYFRVESVHSFHSNDLGARKASLQYQRDCRIPYKVRARIPMWVKGIWVRLHGWTESETWTIEQTDWATLQLSTDIKYEDILLKLTRR